MVESDTETLLEIIRSERKRWSDLRDYAAQRNDPELTAAMDAASAAYAERSHEGMPRWSREDVQRVLYHLVRRYEQAVSDPITFVPPRPPERVGFFWWRREVEPKPAFLGDNELLRDAIRIARETLRDNNWWPDDDS